MLAPKQQMIFDSLLKTGILIGSRAWGGYKQFSDYDLILSVEKYDSIKMSFKNNGIYFENLVGFSERLHGHSMYNMSNDKLYFAEDKIINIITYKKEDLPKIEEMNTIMHFLSSSPIIGEQIRNDKHVRIILVETLLNTLFKDVENKTDDYPF